jgi:acyl-CoA dehydrogenase
MSYSGFMEIEKYARLKKTVKDYVEIEIPREYAREIDQKDEYPYELIKKAGHLGLLGVNVSREYGGMGGNVVDSMILSEEVSKRLPALAWALGNITTYGNEIISINGSKGQKEKYLPRLVKGELLFSFALTEPDAGSDAANIKTSAVYENGYYYINGNKMFISGAGVSDIAVTMTRTGESRYGGITTFLVKCKSDGYQAKPIKKLGYNGSNTCEVVYENVQAAPEDILGGEECFNKGWKQMMNTLNGERLGLSACALGIGQAVLDDIIAFATKNYNFNHLANQSIQHNIVEMATELESARQLAYYAAWLESNHRECVKETSMSKYYCTETAKKLAIKGMDLMGEYGALEETDMQRYLRDVIILTIGGGTSQIQKNIVAKTLGL